MDECGCKQLQAEVDGLLEISKHAAKLKSLFINAPFAQSLRPKSLFINSPFAQSLRPKSLFINSLFAQSLRPERTGRGGPQ
jgi:hypothetical protein